VNVQGTGEPGHDVRCARCDGAHAPAEPCPSAAGRTLSFALGPREPLPPFGPDPLVGAQVGSFRIVRMLGRGGMGAVYLAEHPAIGSKVAVKFLHESASADAAAVDRFYDEARAVNLVGHENIVGVFDLSVLPPARYYYVMEYLEGETLQALLQRGPAPSDLALDVLLQLCDALQCAHEHGVVHRDLKPDNVFLVPRHGTRHFVKLVDFGIAKLRGAGAGRTRAGVLVGTPEYMAPEQCDDGSVDARTDIYSLGIMAFELTTGRLPFTGTVAQLLLSHLRRAPPRPSELAPGVDPRLEATILQAISKSPADRFPDMAAFGDALRATARRLTPPPTLTITPIPGPLPTRTPTPASTPTSLIPDLAVELRDGRSECRRLPVVELNRAGLFLRADGNLPPVFSRVALSVSHPSLRHPLAAAAEVVRLVTSADATAFRMVPGIALQLVDVAPEVRAAFAALAGGVRGRPAPAASVPSGPGAPEARLAVLEARAKGGPYALLRLPPDAELSEIRHAVRGLREELEALRAHPLAPAHPARALALLGRIDAAQAEIAAPAARLVFDARRGNWRGVRRCLAAGVPAALVEARRQELLAADPARAAEAQRQLARAQGARRLGNAAAAAAAWEAALAADPLDVSALDGYVAWRRERETRAP
jgi:eukaryotic-like serine/threonine-protein kinase